MSSGSVIDSIVKFIVSAERNCERLVETRHTLQAVSCAFTDSWAFSYSVSQYFCSSCTCNYTVSKNGPTLKRYSSKLYRSILMIFGRNSQKTLE